MLLAALDLEFQSRIFMLRLAKRLQILLTIATAFLASTLTEGRAQIFSSAEDDKKTGAEIAKQVEEQIGIYQAPVTAEYVRPLASGWPAISNAQSLIFNF